MPAAPAPQVDGMCDSSAFYMVKTVGERLVIFCLHPATYIVDPDRIEDVVLHIVQVHQIIHHTQSVKMLPSERGSSIQTALSIISRRVALACDS
jgi:hypothetical protein